MKTIQELNLAKAKKDGGSLDKRRRVTQKKPKYPPLKPQKHQPDD